MLKFDALVVASALLIAFCAAGIVYWALLWVISPIRRAHNRLFASEWWPVLHMPGARLVADWIERWERE